MSEETDLKFTYKIIIRYDGARYKGWQRLGDDAGGDTIQSKLEGVISTLCDTETLVTGSGRTDAGVHALGQVAHFRCAHSLNTDEILTHCNRYLPDDIAVVNAESADERFHARYKVLAKHYLYQIDTGLWPEPFERKYCWHIPENLDWKKMKDAAALLVGEHDFTSFTSMKSKTKSAVREIFSIEVIPPGKEGDSIALIRLKANGFLHNMARIIVGTLVEVGLGERTVASVPYLLKAEKRAEAGQRAPAKGLFLETAVYKK